ncbi:MAG: hypothetical protein ACE5D4_10290, partial [Thermodesulfobacteriota bacterium]
MHIIGKKQQEHITTMCPAGSAAARNPSLLLIITLLTVSVLAILSPSTVSAENPWEHSYHTQQTTVHYKDEDALFTFTTKVGGRGKRNLTYERNPSLTHNRIDRIVYRVKTMLDMHPVNFHFDIYIYPTYRDLKRVYREMGLMGRAPIAFYAHRSRAIYIVLDRLNEGVFAHEVAHAVINRYFAPPPPPPVQGEQGP